MLGIKVNTNWHAQIVKNIAELEMTIKIVTTEIQNVRQLHRVVRRLVPTKVLISFTAVIVINCFKSKTENSCMKKLPLCSSRKGPSQYQPY